MGQSTIKRNRSKQRRITRRKRRRAAPWAVGGAVLAAVVGLFWATAQGPGGETVKVGARAPAFSLSTTAGGNLSLADLRGKNALLYFSEGVGCDPCFTQMAELEQHQSHMDELGITLVPLMTNPRETVAREATRFGIKERILIDESKQVSKAYDVLGRGHHADLPGHSFILVGGDGTVLWRRDYPAMYVKSSDLLAEVAASVA